MTTVLPPQAGLTVGGVAYRYAVRKELEDAYKVYIENLDKLNEEGKIFSSVDDWSGLPGNTIKKTVPVPDILIDRWGTGQIRTEGIGEVTDANVQYYYKYDECYDPLSNPTCPGWAENLYKYLLDNNLLNGDVEFEDPYWNEFVRALLEAKANLEKIKEEDEQQEEEEEEEEKETLQRVLALNEQVISLAAGLDQEALLIQLSRPEVHTLYKSYNLDGGEYVESLVLKDKKIEDNRSAARMGLASSVLHEKMVNSQYERGRKTNE